MQASSHEKQTEHDQTEEGNRYVKSKKQWKDYRLDVDLIDALCSQGKSQPKRVQAQVLDIIDKSNSKKINLFVGASHGSGKVLALLVPILNSIEQRPKNTEDERQGNVLHNLICKPQGIVIVLTDHLKDHIQGILRHYQQFGEKRNSKKLRFTIGQMDQNAYDQGDLIVCIPKDFVYGFKSGKLSLENCKYIAIYKIDDIFNQELETLAEILKISETHQPNLITCSTTMKRQLTTFFDGYIKDSKKTSIYDIRFQPVGQKITLKRVKHYYKVATYKRDMHEYIIDTIFKQLYENQQKPQIIVFFDSIEQIREFYNCFKTKVTQSSCFKNQEYAYLAKLSVDIIAANKYKHDTKVNMTMAEKASIMTKFRNKETSILLATNIIARGIQIKNACLVIGIGPPKASQKDTDFDFDTYLSRFGRPDRHNHNGLALTLICIEDLQRIAKGLRDIYQADILEMKNPEELANEMWQCAKMNSE